MSERALASRVVKILKPLDALRVENPCHPGTPDVNYVKGWIELKQQDKWPVRPETPVKLDHDLTTGQRIWLTRRQEKGGHAYVLLQIDRDYMLFTGKTAACIIGVANQECLKSEAIFCVSAKELPERLLDELS